MVETLHRIESASALPPAWDELATSYFQRRELLTHAERHNPCAQRYYLLERGGRPVAGACVYTLRLDLLTFARIPSPIRLQFAGVPCSVSAPGILGPDVEAARLLPKILEVERGLLVGLNLDRALAVDGLRFGRTLPTVVLDLPFSSFSDYRAALRSDYRRRVDRTLAAWEGVASERGPCDRMTAELHRQYLAVFERSDAKLERLDLEFFRALPEAFTLTIHRAGDRVLGWHVLLSDGPRRAFFLAGLDYAAIDRYSTYQNILLALVREAIGDGAGSLDLGQTAEIPKTRLGGRLVEKSLFGHSSNPLVRWFLGRAKGLLEYSVEVPEVHVFRGVNA